MMKSNLQDGGQTSPQSSRIYPKSLGLRLIFVVSVKVEATKDISTKEIKDYYIVKGGMVPR
jgi:hypothetical protein